MLQSPQFIRFMYVNRACLGKILQEEIMQVTEDSEISEFRKPAILLFLAGALLGTSFLVWIFYRASLPFQIVEIWFPHRITAWDPFFTAFLWRILVGVFFLVVALLIRWSIYREQWREGIMVVTLNAFATEMLFTWSVFYLAVQIFTIINSVLGGILAKFSIVVIIPLLDTVPGKPFFHPIHDYGWNVALGLVTACFVSAMSREYKGPLGFLNSVTGAFISFFIVFNTPLALAGACLLHIGYNIVEFNLRYALSRTFRSPKPPLKNRRLSLNYTDETSGR